MKIVIGIILVTLILAGLGLYLYFMLTSHELVYCGDITQVSGNRIYITRVYTSDLNANETLSEIVTTMNDNEEGNITAEEMTEILATYQNIIYAPVVMLDLEQKDNNTFVLSGSVFNGLDEEGEPVQPDFSYKNLVLTAGLSRGEILAAQNVYSEDVDEEGEPEFKERLKVVDPILIEENMGAAFAFNDCDSFRMVFNGIPEVPASVTLALTYDVVADNPLNFTSLSDGAMGMTVTVAYDEAGRLTPELTMSRVYTSGEAIEGE
ncbi:MAG: hypothetical protein ACI4JS_05320 [Oscillospiraceae bacterium]